MRAAHYEFDPESAVFSRVEIRALDDSLIQDHFGGYTLTSRTQLDFAPPRTAGRYRVAAAAAVAEADGKYERRPSSL